MGSQRQRERPTNSRARLAPPRRECQRPTHTRCGRNHTWLPAHGLNRLRLVGPKSCRAPARRAARTRRRRPSQRSPGSCRRLASRPTGARRDLRRRCTGRPAISPVTRATPQSALRDRPKASECRAGKCRQSSASLRLPTVLLRAKPRYFLNTVGRPAPLLEFPDLPTIATDVSVGKSGF